MDGRFNASLRAGKNTRLQLNTIYVGPTVTAQGEREGMWGMNLSARQDFLKKKLSATVQVRDIFDTMNYNFTSGGLNFNSTQLRDRESQIVLFTLSYRVNNYQPDRKNQRSREGLDIEDEM